MTMTNEQATKLRQWISQKTLLLQCEVCRSSNWVPGDVIMAPSHSGSGNAFDFGNGIPMAQVICSNCGNIKLFAAAMMDLVK